MRKFVAGMLLGICTFLGGWYIGWVSDRQDADAAKAQTEHPYNLKGSHWRELLNAQNYADWCGGFVQVIGGDVTVEGCDQ